MANNNKDIDKFIGQLTRISSLINDRQVNLRLARKCREIVYRRVKSGKGVSSDSLPSESTTDKRLKPLSESYIDYRKGKVRFYTSKRGKVYPIFGKFPSPVTGEFGRPSVSNLTLTGQMLNSIVMSASETEFVLFIANTKRKDGKLTNQQVADYVSKDRPFFALTAGEVRILQRELENIIKEIIERVSR